MLSSEIIKKIKKIHVKSGRMVDTIMAGNYRSVFRGSGIEFEEVREYSPGDDVKSIDWNVSARMGRPFVKLYREEREQVLMLLIDLSGSMGFGTAAARKKDAAAEIAAILAFNAIRNNDRVGAIFFTDRVEKYIPPQKGSAHIWRVIREIFTYQPEHRGTDIQSALTYLGNVYPKKTVAFLISDFLSPDSTRELRIMSKKHELISVFVADTGDFSLPSAGLLRLEDMETGQTLLVDASSAAVRRTCESLKNKEKTDALEMLRSSRVDCIQILADKAAASDVYVANALSNYFRYREQRMR
jgi:uncharacterized protein (DUF58 family)